jgi:predicted RNA-binding Zn ribbon-like protein
MAVEELQDAMMGERPEPFFVAGSVGLDFLNSIATPVDVPVEWLASGDDLLAWLQSAQLLSSDAAVAVRKTALPGEIDAVATQARALREWFQAFVHAHRGQPLEAETLGELEPLNHLLGRDEEFTQIVVRTEEKLANSPLRLARLRQWPSPDALLLPIAEALADVVCNENFANIKACEGSVCSLLYIDRTRALARRWCSMAACGNRSKQAAHRVRTSGRRTS